MNERFALGWDFSTQQVKAIGVGLTTGEIFFEEFLKFDEALPHYKTKGGVRVHPDGATITSPTLMWVEALDRLLAQLKARGVEFSQAAVICGSGQQHGSVYWRTGARDTLRQLKPELPMAEQLAACFSTTDSPVWMDSSTGEQCAQLEAFAGGPEALAALTGARAFHRYTAAQLMKQRLAGTLADTERVSLVSSFAASLFLGDYASIDEADGSGMNLMSLAERAWVPRLCDFVQPGLESLLGPIVPGRTILGRVSAYLSARWGFSLDCRVAAFTGDNPATLAGLRLQPGCLAVTLGSSSCALLRSPGRCLPAGAALPSLGCVNGALTREAIRDRFAGGSWAEFDRLLDSRPPGNGGLVGLYFDSPEIVPEGALGRYRFGADGEPLPDGANFVEGPAAEARACLESHAMSLRLFAESLGFRPGEPGARVLATGGASANPRVAQVLADALATPVIVQPGLGNSAALGAALLGASALAGPSADFLASLPPDSGAGVESRTFEPRPEAAPAYQSMRDRFPGLLARAAKLQAARLGGSA
uniref:Xylulose kinase n=1 Tax=Macrostomum lignano TaxID=282301 RepID=A0A1I8JHV1_9PLAT